MSIERLTAADYEEARAFLLREPVMNVILLANAMNFGLEQGPGPFNADYFAGRGASGIEVIGALYNLGAFFFRATCPEAVSGLAREVLELGRVPGYTAGTRRHVEVFLDELGEAAGRPEPIESEYMVLRRGGLAPQDTSRARPAKPADLDQMLSLQVDFELECFGKNVAGEASIRKLLEHQISRGAAVVVEESGRVVSKAEGTVARPHAALIGGVYTVPERRGAGLSKACVGELCRVLLDQAEAVGLNVFTNNLPARGVYFAVGFEVAEEWLTVEMA